MAHMMMPVLAHSRQLVPRASNLPRVFFCHFGHALALLPPDLHFQPMSVRLMEDRSITCRHLTHSHVYAHPIRSTYHRIPIRSLHRMAYHGMLLRLHRLDHRLPGCSVWIRMTPPRTYPAHRRHMSLPLLDADFLRSGEWRLLDRGVRPGPAKAGLGFYLILETVANNGIGQPLQPGRLTVRH